MIHITIHDKTQDLTKILKDLIDLDVGTFKTNYGLFKEGRDWSVETSKTDINEDIQNLLEKPIKSSSDLNDNDWKIIKQNRFRKIQYRAFNERWSYFSQKQKGFIAYPRWEIMQHLIEKDNIGLVFSRQVSKDKWKHVFITDKITDGHSISGWTYVAPLYLNHKKCIQSKLVDDKELDNSDEDCKLVNFTENFKKFISKQYTPTPDTYDIFSYIYAIFHSNVYREKFDEFLKLDFPRIPFIDDFNKFMELSKLGKNLIDTHLLKNTFGTFDIAKYPVEGDDIVEKIRYEEKTQKLYINKEQYFEIVPKMVWEFEIGDYKVLDKWLKYKKGTKLSYADINHFQKVVCSLADTILIMDKIDNVVTF